MHCLVTRGVPRGCGKPALGLALSLSPKMYLSKIHSAMQVSGAANLPKLVTWSPNSLMDFTWYSKYASQWSLTNKGHFFQRPVCASPVLTGWHFFQVQCKLHCIQPTLPVILFWFLDILEKDPATLLVLQLHQCLSMLLLLMRLKKIRGEVLQSHITVVKVVRLGQVDAGSIELQVDLVVDCGLWTLLGSSGAPVRRCDHHDRRLRTGGFAALERWRGPWGSVRRWQKDGSEQLAGMGVECRVPFKHCRSRKPRHLSGKTIQLLTLLSVLRC